MKTFYRLEIVPEPGELIGGGPYTGYLSDGQSPIYALFGSRGSKIDIHPTPYNDEGLQLKWDMLSQEGTNTKYVFGFKSLNQLHNWFFFNEEGVRNLIEEYPNEMRVGIYEVEDDYFYSGQFQAIAHKDHMQLSKSLTIEEAFEQGK
jgi:hypothetical protein